MLPSPRLASNFHSVYLRPRVCRLLLPLNAFLKSKLHKVHPLLEGGEGLIVRSENGGGVRGPGRPMSPELGDKQYFATIHLAIEPEENEEGEVGSSSIS